MIIRRTFGHLLAAVTLPLGWVVTALFFSTMWWRLWIYHGWPGASGILARVWHADGEGAYSAMAAEMFFICAVFLALAAFGSWCYLRHSRGAAPRARV